MRLAFFGFNFVIEMRYIKKIYFFLIKINFLKDFFVAKYFLEKFNCLFSIFSFFLDRFQIFSLL
jgi:hypothetical protein